MLLARRGVNRSAFGTGTVKHRIGGGDWRAVRDKNVNYVFAIALRLCNRQIGRARNVQLKRVMAIRLYLFFVQAMKRHCAE